ncbi:MAG: secondary thiamine-phosphate synthase enzyme YjbQ [Bacteroidota bacterium]
MTIHSATFSLRTQGFNDVRDLTPQVQNHLRLTGISKGTVTIFVPGSTAAITTIEYEDGAIDDLKKAVERLAPANMHYNHDARWGDGNGFSHVRAALLGPSLSVPVINGDLQLGTWQQIVLVDCDNRPRNREVIVQIVGE